MSTTFKNFLSQHMPLVLKALQKVQLLYLRIETGESPFTIAVDYGKPLPNFDFSLVALRLGDLYEKSN